MTITLRPPAVPLVTIDPYFSVWSMADRLTGDFTRHWTGKRNALTGLIRIDGTPWRFAGLTEPNPENYYAEPEAMQQTELQVTPLSTSYTFEAGGIALEVVFTSPLLPDSLELLSRPASYVSFRVRSLDGNPHAVQLYIDVTGEWCVNTSEQKVVLGQEQNEYLTIMAASNAEQQVLNASGDDLRIDWGRLMLAVKQAPDMQTWIGPAEVRKSFVRTGELKAGSKTPSPNEAQTVRDTQPVLAAVWNCGEVDGKAGKSQLIVLAYDDVYSIEYFGRRLEAYWKKDGQTTMGMIEHAFREYSDILLRCEAFDRQLQADAVRSGGEKYADILSLSYRQAIAAHKLVLDPEGQPLFMSKECFSNGCIATVDVSYPSIPLFLLYQPELVRGMMRPILKYAASEAWPFEFAPHDVGQYPLANGQVYGENAREAQMPVEECGNMLVMAAAVSLADGQWEFAAEHRELLSRWADYLLEYGLDPENQLCTDDFAGHLARNANLSAKAIMGVASYSLLCRQLGDSAEADRYLQAARDMASQWTKLAEDQSEGSTHTKLVFGEEGEGTWSLKYNLVWDLIFGTNLFDPSLVRRETAWYLEKQNRYGVPLDNREAYTKGDWLVWAASLAEERKDFEQIIAPLWDFLNETPDRVPFSDWYDTITARQIGFQHRSVVGGMFIKLLKDQGISKK
ncbi:glutaminase [Paenibacillus yonginensis]|uniref:Glutaminase n=1 Tax=Paenibacillus yonginensis TaxID=1462996 RepID=A0A1B1MY72_9BACL|nr:glutaminase family protein [Paenibacillus yonginensis]ANS74107.1 glutaminase [Paenibacillus yonginensis]